ncbi:cysteine hydrolase family protein [Roseateles koreensis]|uniref:Cysteine hydrolase family protein n=1 Tax=Roseateles koreensis TaxID=2987526 RepID=A0ABT5KLZ0_9BURK|nr:cysteine hydrolase family protein [Roseateles koreensis]MDC8783933.1 cysteine hydrolase family protein [Roseateles koreensis]
MNPTTALLIIDIQNDYFPGGAFELWNAEATLDRIEAAVHKAQACQIPVILVQHVAKAGKGPAPFFNAGTAGVALHPRMLAAAPGAPVVIKQSADSFHDTNLDALLSQLGIKRLLVCGMMTQNCVAFTATSKPAEKYAVQIVSDCCTTVSEMLHLIALSGVSTRIPLLSSAEAF